MKIRRMILIGLVVLVVVIVAAGLYIYNWLDKETEELAQIDAEIVFMSDAVGNWDIMLYAPDGTISNLTEDDPDGAQDIFPNFDFGGEVINFFSTRDGELTPAIVNVDGSGLETFSWIMGAGKAMQEQRFDSDPAWGPGGTLRAWSKIKMLQVELYLSNGDGTDERQMTNGSATDYMEAWSSDGQHVVYISDESGKQDVYVLDVESGEITQLTDNGLDDMMPVYSMDGTQILLITGDGSPMTSTKLDFFIMNADGSDLRAFDPATDTFEGDPTYSPSGAQVAYVSNADGTWQIYVMNADGSDVQRLTDGESNNLYPVWRPIPTDELAAE